jgi:hypothetical protein
MAVELFLYEANRLDCVPKWWDEIMEQGLFKVQDILREHNAGFRLGIDQRRIISFENEDDKLLFVLRYVK